MINVSSLLIFYHFFPNWILNMKKEVMHLLFLLEFKLSHNASQIANNIKSIGLYGSSFKSFYMGIWI